MATVLCRAEAHVVYVCFIANLLPVKRGEGGAFFDFRQIIPKYKSIVVVIHVHYITLVCEKM